ncbi:MAG: UDP-N-acetylglucosamine 1-carboxyvinyltransferase [Clostridiales bacterium GWF2_38_85]|nr:MAG: UDP-N-acetylglucosamine 1-carboxyvinyltransferase [Clostridiales bacterium GWF2_38_85]HBL84569.1 UDP-N-acetylglucosamine 1-carboxyvinyltransferase [Clostridiales bacterium]
MEKIIVSGGNTLQGEIEVSGMKNSAVAILFATILVDGKCVIENLPPVDDVCTSIKILEVMGASVKWLNKTSVEINTKNIIAGKSPDEFASKMRASYYVLGAELGRFGTAYSAKPGGCDFGVRPIDRHIKGFEALGATVEEELMCIRATTENGLVGNNIFMDDISVGATINIILAAVTASGVTTIDNAAREPHVVDLANFLNACGAEISGAGTDMIKIKGVRELTGVTYAIVPDMIEAGTYMIAGAVRIGNHLKITNVIPKHLESITAKLIEMGVNVEEGDDYVIVSRTEPLKPINVKTLPYPSFPTDMNPQICVLLTLAEGNSRLIEGVWDGRFKYTEELIRMGADIKVNGRSAVVTGVKKLTGARVRACDLRAGAAMVIAALATDGMSEIEEIYHIRRGYDNMEAKLRGVGADIKAINIPDIFGINGLLSNENKCV